MADCSETACLLKASTTHLKLRAYAQPKNAQPYAKNTHDQESRGGSGCFPCSFHCFCLRTRGTREKAKLYCVALRFFVFTGTFSRIFKKSCTLGSVCFLLKLFPYALFFSVASIWRCFFCALQRLTQANWPNKLTQVNSRFIGPDATDVGASWARTSHRSSNSCRPES